MALAAASIQKAFTAIMVISCLLLLCEIVLLEALCDDLYNSCGIPQPDPELDCTQNEADAYCRETICPATRIGATPRDCCRDVPGGGMCCCDPFLDRYGSVSVSPGNDNDNEGEEKAQDEANCREVYKGYGADDDGFLCDDEIAYLDCKETAGVWNGDEYCLDDYRACCGPYLAQNLVAATPLPPSKK